ncbi:MAG TPA: glycosyltransferase [Solirubrobacterales bacterium]
MRICLFEWNAGGHHNFYARAFAEALAPRAEVVVAAPEPVLAELGSDLGVTTHSLGEPRPRPGAGEGLDKATLAKREIELLRESIAASRPDQAIILFADPILRWLASAPRFDCRVSAFVMFAKAQLPGSYGLPLSPKERARAAFKELSLARWRRRRDAYAVFGLDQAAVARWQRRRGAPARWLAEPRLEVEPPRRRPEERSGCFLFGSIDRRKGIDRLAAALAEGCEGLPLTIYGSPVPEYREQLERELAALREAGVKVETDLTRVPYAAAMEAMGGARCALLSFGWKEAPGSRVLIEAAGARTPVVIGNDNVAGRIVERYGLGLTPDPDDPAAIRDAILELALDPGAPARYEENLRRYAEEVHGDRFVEQVRAAFELDR